MCKHCNNRDTHVVTLENVPRENMMTVTFIANSADMFILVESFLFRVAVIFIANSASSTRGLGTSWWLHWQLSRKSSCCVPICVWCRH